MTNPEQTPGELIRQAIAAAGLNQKTVAERIGITGKHLSEVVTGKSRLSRHVAVRLEDELGVSAVDLLVAQITIDVANNRYRRGER